MMSEIALQEMIQADLAADPRVSSQTITVTIQDGVATLSGTVQSFRRKLAAQQIVQSYQGVRDVRNELAVEPAMAESDEEVAEAVRNALNSSADVTKEAITVAVNAGTVTLTGNAGSVWERTVAEDVARGVRGVRDVVNLILIDTDHKIDDSELAHSIQAALNRARGLVPGDVRVAVTEGVAVLSGEVSEPWQREVAETVVGKFGLLHVRNEIQLKQ
ncbi:MAG: BON domain-containing protein [Planctomycetota bacterium]|nr:MAG: BON domain-containing protein [Planctomycetota bacterium]